MFRIFGSQGGAASCRWRDHRHAQHCSVIRLPLTLPHCIPGDGCGHTVLTPHSGTLTSKNYPGTYPNHTACEWRIQAADGSSLLMAFGDMDIESSQHCTSSFLLLSSPSDGPYCGNLNPVHKALVLNSSSVTIHFNSTTHRSGRGFLLSYTTSHHPDLISCLDKGTHYNQEQISVFCPAGCKGVAGDIWGNMKQGYRDTSVLCKAGIHAGMILDELGGQLTLSQEKGITLYESAFANGLYSKRGSLSEKRLIFHKGTAFSICPRISLTLFNASSSWEELNTMGQYKLWTAEQAAFNAHGNSWAADPSSENQWLEIDLGGRKNITGIITKGSSDKYNYYVKSYRVSSSKDGKNWKVYRSNSGHDDKIFEGNIDSFQEVSHTFIPPILARYLRIMPQSWNHRIALKVALQGCQVARLRAPRPYGERGWIGSRGGFWEGASAPSGGWSQVAAPSAWAVLIPCKLSWVGWGHASVGRLNAERVGGLEGTGNQTPR
uniref:Discoidin, CUB and LCCL domain containing 1 n=1 Tax=Pelusios castaneus TaxID=367368 RepID=A0A8C8RA77_9SAUR